MSFLIRLFIFFTFIQCIAQPSRKFSNDNYKKIETKIRHLFGADLDSVVFYSNQLEVSYNKNHIAFAKAAKAYAYQIKGDTIVSNENINKAFKIVKNSKDKDLEITSLVCNFAGLTYWKRGDLVKALNYFEEGIGYSKKINDKIQILKFQDNISLIYADLGKIEKAIEIAKENDLKSYSYFSSTEDLKVFKSKLYGNLGHFYRLLYDKEQKEQYLDSSLVYFNKTLKYSENLAELTIRIKKNIGAIYYSKGDVSKAEKQFLNSIVYANENNMREDIGNINLSLGMLYYDNNDFDKSLLCFKKVDSIYKNYNLSSDDYIFSAYYQSKIYDAFDDYKKASAKAKEFLGLYDKNQAKILIQELEINSKIANSDLEVEIEKIKQSNDKKKILYIAFYSIVTIVFFLILLFLLKNIKDRKKAELKIEKLIQEFKKDDVKDYGQDDSKEKKYSINIDDTKELEILNKLKELEKLNYFLRLDFNQQTVAKKIKTNTSYLSYVVNKNFGKTFSEYSNELKINFLIDDLVNNPIKRNYTTQALAESVGFKNANSFTVSFKKRTGVSPVQFIKKLMVKH